jgi:hypothetical protein
MEPFGRVFQPFTAAFGAGTERLWLAALLIWATVGCANPVVPDRLKIAISAKSVFMLSPVSLV